MERETFKHSYQLEHIGSAELAIYNCGLQKCEAGHHWGPAVRDHFLIHFILSGSGSYESGGRRYELTAGSGFLSTPATVIHYQADQLDPWEYVWVGFNGTDADRLIDLTGLSTENPIFYARPGHDLAGQLTAIFDATGHRPSDEIRMRGRLLEFLATLIDMHADRSHQRAGSHDRQWQYVEKSIRFIQYNYSRPITVDDIAKSVGISRSHLYRLFMDHLSISPNEYLSRFRIDESCLLLTNQKLSVSEAAYSSGFSDQFYFSRVFKKLKGVSPSEYRKNPEAAL